MDSSASPLRAAGPSTHAKALFETSIGRHPVAAAAVIGALVVAVLVLGYLYANARAAASAASAAPAAAKAGFLSPTGHMPGTHAHWELGNADAGNGGSVHRDITALQAAVFLPGAAGPGACGAWSPEAHAEAGALSAAGGLHGHDEIHGGAGAGGAGSAGSAGAIDDHALAAMMHAGGSP